MSYEAVIEEVKVLPELLLASLKFTSAVSLNPSKAVNQCAQAHMSISDVLHFCKTCV